MSKKIILSGMRSTGPLHIGHLFGVLKNWVKFQDKYECLFMIADWHALMSEYKDVKKIRNYTIECAADWIASGIDPKKSTIFVQSHVPEHLELNTILSVITPIPWLERCPTYKEQLQELKDKDIFTYAFLGYPVLQAADILLYKANAVPIGQDQLPHLELTREILRRFHFIFNCGIFPEPEAILNESSKILGTDRRKMSKSYNNFIALSEEPDSIRKKILSMITDESRIKKSDPGHPDICNVFSYYKIFAPEMENQIRYDCENAIIGCVENKKRLAEKVIDYLAPIREKKLGLMNHKDDLMDMLYDGAKNARKRAKETIAEVKEIMNWL